MGRKFKAKKFLDEPKSMMTMEVAEQDLRESKSALDVHLELCHAFHSRVKSQNPDWLKEETKNHFVAVPGYLSGAHEWKGSSGCKICTMSNCWVAHPALNFEDDHKRQMLWNEELLFSNLSSQMIAVYLDMPAIRRYSVHRAVLAKHSPYLAELLSETGANSLLLCSHPNNEAFPLVLEFLYRGSIPGSLQPGRSPAAQLLDARLLVLLYSIAERIDLRALLELALGRILEHTLFHDMSAVVLLHRHLEAGVAANASLFRFLANYMVQLGRSRLATARKFVDEMGQISQLYPSLVDGVQEIVNAERDASERTSLVQGEKKKEAEQMGKAEENKESSKEKEERNMEKGKKEKGKEKENREKVKGREKENEWKGKKKEDKEKGKMIEAREKEKDIEDRGNNGKEKQTEDKGKGKEREEITEGNQKALLLEMDEYQEQQLMLILAQDFSDDLSSSPSSSPPPTSSVFALSGTRALSKPAVPRLGSSSSSSHDVAAAAAFSSSFTSSSSSSSSAAFAAKRGPALSPPSSPPPAAAGRARSSANDDDDDVFGRPPASVVAADGSARRIPRSLAEIRRRFYGEITAEWQRVELRGGTAPRTRQLAEEAQLLLGRVEAEVCAPLRALMASGAARRDAARDEGLAGALDENVARVVLGLKALVPELNAGAGAGGGWGEGGEFVSEKDFVVEDEEMS